MNHAKQRVRPDEVPRIDWGAAVLRIARQLLRVNRGYSAFGQAGSWRAAIQDVVVKVDALVVVGGCSGRRSKRNARTRSQTGTGSLRWSIERPVVRHVVVKTRRLRRSSGRQRRHSWK